MAHELGKTAVKVTAGGHLSCYISPKEVWAPMSLLTSLEVGRVILS